MLTLIFSIIGIALLSILLAFWSLRQEVKKTGVEKEVKKDLASGRVIFYPHAAKNSNNENEKEKTYSSSEESEPS